MAPLRSLSRSAAASCCAAGAAWSPCRGTCSSAALQFQSAGQAVAGEYLIWRWQLNSMLRWNRLPLAAPADAQPA